MKNILNKFILALALLPSAALAVCNPFVGGTQLSASALNNALASPCITAGSITGVPISNATINSSAIGSTTPAAGSFTTLNASGAVSGVGVTALLASPPAIGSTAPSSGAFTTLSASSTVSLSPANANVTISPTGTSVVTINPAAASTINNTSIGGTVAAPGAFTTLSASSSVSGPGFSTYLASPPAIGGTVAAAGSFTALNASGLLTQGDSTAAAGVTQLGGMFSTNTASGNNLIARKSFTGTNAPNIVTIKSRGTNASPTVIVTGDSLGSFSAYGYDGTNYIASGSIANTSEGTIGTGIVPSRWSISTANSSGVNTEALRIDSSQNVLVTAPSGLGYGAGSGGTVTQATSKTTAVTLNKPSGQITMNNAALAGGASVIFILNNSLITTNDMVQTITVGFGSAYYAHPINISAGAVAISVTNVSGGSLSDAVLVNYQIIKGSIN